MSSNPANSMDHTDENRIDDEEISRWKDKFRDLDPKDSGTLSELLKSEELPSCHLRLFERIVTILSKDKKHWEVPLLGILGLRYNGKKFESYGEVDVLTREGFASFFALSHMYRRYRKTEMFGALLDHYKEKFRKDDIYGGLFSFLKSMHRKMLGGLKNLKNAYDLSKEAAASLDKHIGVVHNYAETIVLCVESGVFRNEKERKVQLREALEKVVYAKRKEDYPKYYLTEARIEIEQRHYEEAKKLILLAISKEDPDTADYFQRIGSFDFLFEKACRKEEFDSLLDKTTMAKQMVEELQTRVYESVAFFAAILALIVTMVNASGTNLAPASNGSMLTLIGGILVAFAGLSTVLYKIVNLKKVIVLSILGLSLIVFSTVILPLING